MTREEAKRLLEKMMPQQRSDIKSIPYLMITEAFSVAIKALEQQPKTGHWIEGQTDNPNIHNILCSCCFEGYPSKGHANSQYTKGKFQWCPKCGAKMEGEYEVSN